MMKLTPLFIPLALAGMPALANEDKPADIEEITVYGTYFNDYKVDSARGAMRMDTSLLETAPVGHGDPGHGDQRADRQHPRRGARQ